MANESRQSDDGDPHAGLRVARGGPEVTGADAVLVLLHGRGGTSESMLALYEALALPEVAALVPHAAGNSWYPQSFLAPIEANEPFLSSALGQIEGLIGGLLDRGTTSDRIALLGFSQGACLASEYAARHPRRYGAVIAFTGGLIGPPGVRRDYAGTLNGTPTFLGASDPDMHVPFVRVEETAAVFTKMGAVVALRRYPGMAHTINEDELAAARELIQRISSQ